MNQSVKNLPANAGDPGLIPGLERSPGEGNGNTIQFSCLEYPHGQRSLGGGQGATVFGISRVRHDLVAK